MSKRALLVGNNNYANERDLTCCVDDAKAMAAMLGRHADGSRNYDCLLLTSDQGQVTEEALRGKVQQLTNDIRGGDVVFYFSGHGVASEDGGSLVTHDSKPDDRGYPMGELLEIANQSEVGSILLILDCCNSGSIGNSGNDQKYNQVTLTEGVTILAASSEKQESQEGLEYSLFTELLLHALEGGAADIRGYVSAASLYAYAEQALSSWQQRPMYKSHARQLNPIRHCEPAVRDDVLRQMTSLFRGPDMQIIMDPSFEHTHESHNADNVAKFNAFKQLRNAGLLNTTDGKDLYYAAMESGSAALTTLGKFYWRLVKNDRI
ncbi:MAG: caspase family protein [Pseudomonadales bacterium]